MDKLQERASSLEKEIADKLDDEQWENWQIILKYINERNKIINLMVEELQVYYDETKEKIKKYFTDKAKVE